MNLPSSWIEAIPAFSAASKAATTRSAKLTSASPGVKTRLTTATWAGWMHILPWNPRPCASRAEASSPSASARSTHTVASGGARGADHPPPRIGKLGLAAAPAPVGVEGDVAGAEGDAAHPAAAAQDRVDIREAPGGLDDRDQVDRARREARLA